MNSTQFIKRTQSDFAYTYGLGEVVSEGVTLFRAGNYNLSESEFYQKLAKAKKDNLRQKEEDNYGKPRNRQDSQSR